MGISRRQLVLFYGMMLRKNPKRNYEAYAEVYDIFKGDRSENIRLLQRLIKRYRPKAIKLLDLACGTGAIAQGLSEEFTIVGLDNAPQMLKVAKNKLPSMRLVCAEMVGFTLHQKFDVVYCLHNSVNHLLTIQEWESLFSNVSKHLNKGGVFIFDINPIKKMNELAKWGLGTTQIGEDFVITQVTKDARKMELYHWDVKIFLKQRGNRFVLEHESIKVSAFPLDQVMRMLVQTFDVIDSFVLENAEKTDDVGRAYYVCSKK